MPEVDLTSPESAHYHESMSRRKLLYILLSLAVTLVLLALLLRQIDPALLKKTLLNVYLPGLAAYVALYLVSVWLRAWRYRLLLRPQTCSWGGILLATLIRNSFDDLLPARLGSLSYIYVLNQRLGVSFEAATSSFVVAFVLDFLTLGPFLILAVLAAGAISVPLSKGALVAAALCFCVMTGLILWKLAPLAGLAVRIFQNLLRRFRQADKQWARLAVAKLDQVRDSLNMVREAKTMAVVFIQSLFIRLAKYVSIYCLLFGLLRSQGYRPGDLSFWKTILGLTGAEFTAALPVKGIAGFGTWETAWTYTFRLLGFPRDLAVVSGLGVHLITNALEYGLGILSLLILALPFLKKNIKK
jgi:uncharacterized membrane protein YbhN (UPF0104 family)